MCESNYLVNGQPIIPLVKDCPVGECESYITDSGKCRETLEYCGQFKMAEAEAEEEIRYG